MTAQVIVRKLAKVDAVLSAIDVGCDHSLGIVAAAYIHIQSQAIGDLCAEFLNVHTLLSPVRATTVEPNKPYTPVLRSHLI
jgi:hypothetical protein